MRLLFFAGSTREGSYNKKLAALARHIAEANGIEAVQVDLKDYPMPLYNGDLEAKDGPPRRRARSRPCSASIRECSSPAPNIIRRSRRF